MELLQVNHLNVTFHDIWGELTAVHDLSFYMKQGEILGIIGESGSGKSATAKAIMGLLDSSKGASSKGEILFNGQDLNQMSKKEICRIRGKEITMVFQEPMTALNPVMTIYDQMNEVFRIHKIGNKAENKKNMTDTLNLLGIQDSEAMLKKYPFELSGGLRQRIVIAMAVVGRPKIIIADEPTTALDVTTQAEILKLLKKVSSQFDSSILLITHDLGVIAEIADRVMVMYGGMEMETCDTETLFDGPAHPYSKALMASRPSNFNGRYYAIKGNVEQNYGSFIGCPYSKRCEVCQERCRREIPCVKEMDHSHRISCFFPELAGGQA